MKEIISFFQEIFMMKNEDKIKVGLSQFKKTETIIEKKERKPVKSEVKLSDLMRRA